MDRRLAAVGIAVLVALAGCGTTVERIGLEVGVTEVRETGSGYEIDVVLSTYGDLGDRTFEAPGVAGYDAAGRRVCTATFGDVGTGFLTPNERTGTLACEGFPLVLVAWTGKGPPGSVAAGWGEGRDGAPGPTATPTPDPTPTPVPGETVRYVEHRAAAYVGYGATGHAYEPVPGADPRRGLRYAKCRTWATGANVSAVDGPALWMVRDRRPPNVTERIELRAQPLGEDGYSGPLQPYPLPADETLAPVRAFLDEAARTERESEFSMVESERPITREQYVAWVGRLLGTPVSGVGDVPRNRTAYPRAAVHRIDSRRVDCPAAEYDGRREVVVRTVVESTGGTYWSLEFAYEERWRGPALADEG